MKQKRRQRLQAIVMVFLLLMSTVISPVITLAEGTPIDDDSVEQVNQQKTSSTKQQDGENSEKDAEEDTENDDAKESSAEETSSKSEKEKDESESKGDESSTVEEDVEDEDSSVKEEENGQVEEEKHEEAGKETDKEVAEKKASTEEKHGFTLQISEVTDLDGVPYDEDHLLTPQEEFFLDLEWNLENGHNYEEDDTVNFQLPLGIKIQEQIEVDLKDESGLVVAHAIITPDNNVELTFTDFVETHSNVLGHMKIVSKLDEENAEIDDGDLILKPIGDEDEIRIPIDLGDREKTIEKSGTPNKGYNADEINWEVTINKLKADLENAKVTDVLPEGTEYKEGSLKVTKLKVDINGNVLGDLEEVDVNGEVVDGELTIPLGDTNDAYRIEYVTKVTDDEQETFKNNATLTDNDLEDVSAQSTVTINRGDPIKKSAVTDYNPKTGIIEWEIEFNFNQKDLKDVTLKDAWTPEGKMHLVEDSLKFQEVTIDDNGQAHEEGEAINLPEGAKLVNGEDQFEVTGITTDKAYKVTYQTKVNDRVLDDFSVSNIAGFGNESDSSGKYVGTHYGAKSAGNVDYKNKTIEWTMRINQDEYPMEQISIEDTVGDGLTLDKDTIAISVDGKPYEGKYTVSDGNPFVLTFPEDFTTDKEIIITYKTKFVADGVPDNIAKNKADITWTPEGENGSITKEVEAETPLNQQTEDNSWKNGSYNPDTKEITWTIYTNYRENHIDDLIIKDEPQGNQKIVEDSPVVTELEIASNGEIIEGETLDSSVSTIDVDNNTLEVNIGETDKAYKIEYKTSLNNLSDIQKEYVNKAEVFDGEDSLSEIDAKVGIAKAHTYGDKSGQQDGKQIHWAVTVNPGQQQVKNLKLEDTVSDNQDILPDTFKVYEASIDGSGNATKKGDPISTDRYELTHVEGEPTFTVEWNDTVDRAFIVEYSTLFFAGHGENVTNSYNVTGNNIVEGGKTDGEGSVTIKQLGSGGGSGEAGYLIIDKIDTTDGASEKLKGAEFDLIDADTGNVLKSGTTDENGQIDFGRLLFGDYILHETNIPDGLVNPNDNNKETITIDKVYDADSNKQEYAYTVENYEPVFAIELLKTDEADNALKGAEYTLYDSENNELASAETDDNGKIIFENLMYSGTYYVQEIKAPAGYVLDSEKHFVNVGEKEKEPVKLSTLINKSRGGIQLTKKDKDTGEPLEGVEFVLQKENDSGGYDTIKTYTTDDKGKIKTSNTLEAGNYQFVEIKSLDGYRTDGNPIKFVVNVNSEKDQVFTKFNEKYKGFVKLIKEDSVTKELLSGAEFKLIDSDGNLVKQDLVTDHNGVIVIEDLILGEYQLIETKAPAGYELDDTPININLTEDNQVIEKTMTNNKITNISVEKKWNIGDSDTKPVTVKLLPTGQAAELNEENDWKFTFENLYVYDESGKEIDYHIEELDSDNYNSTITGNINDGFIVTNTETTSVSGVKTWLDDDSEDRPDTIIVKLLANGNEVDTIEVMADTDWQYEFTDVDKYDENGNEILYTVEEVRVEGYEPIIDGYDITNLRIGSTSVKGEKTWKDGDSTDRPDSITVNLTREVDGKQDEDFFDSITVEPDKSGNWLYEFTDLEEFDENGVAYTYIVAEDNVPDNYESIVIGHDITNVRIGKTEVSGTKRWKDDKIDDRPNSIKVNLLRNDVVVDTKEVTADDNWKYNFTDLQKYDNEGKLYEYTVKEQEVPGYHSEVSGFDITNTRSAKKSIEITKAWLDSNSKERPESIIVYVYQNGELFDTLKIKSIDGWKYEIEDLEAFDKDGKPYTYTVKEKPLEGYETTINGFDITNLRVGKTDISGTKTWKDDNAPDRPESIIVNLLQNGSIVDSQEVTAEDNWEYNFTDLEKYDEKGVPYDYTIDEEEVKNYTKSVDGYDLINTRTGKTVVSGIKIWKDGNSPNRPDSITVKLLQNGSLFATQKVTAEDNWKYSFTNLEKYDEDGREIEYTIEEVNVPGYTTTIDGFNITNTLDSEDPNDPEKPEDPGSEDPTDPEDPKDPGSKDPTDPEDPEDPDSKDPNDLISGDQGDKGNKGKQLPKTATTMFNMLLIGLSLILIGCVIRFYPRRTEE